MTDLNAKVLFVTYDGLLDPLGGSQILPYLRSIATHPRRLHVISFEKKSRFLAGAQQLSEELRLIGIEWTPLPFTSRLGKIGKLWDLARMYGTALRLQIKNRFGIVHCRSYQAMQVGCLLKRLTGSKALFDMRGLWVDERIDGGIWDKESFTSRFIFQQYKRIERNLLACATHVISLTERVIPELQKLSPRMVVPVTVIPCCADFDHFALTTEASNVATRASFGVPSNALLLSYLGSLGTWYMLEDMLIFFGEAARNRNDVEFLIISRDWQDEHERLVEHLGLKDLRARIHIQPATRDEVPALVGCSDVMLSFIKPAYSKIASSPTKLAESLALGVPVISNTGIGDVDEITRSLAAGVVVDLTDRNAVVTLANSLDGVKAMGGPALRARARPALGLEVAEAAYKKVYRQLEARR